MGSDTSPVASAMHERITAQFNHLHTQAKNIRAKGKVQFVKEGYLAVKALRWMPACPRERSRRATGTPPVSGIGST